MPVKRALSMELFLDFETRSKADLRRVGAHRYAADPSTEILCASWAVDDGPVKKWTPLEHAAWLELARNPAVLIVAHNAEFERLILIHRCGLFGPAAEPIRFRCTAAQAARAGLPRSLDAAGRLWGIEHLKDKETGSRLIKKLSKPRRASKKNPDEFWERETAPEDFEALEVYNIRDVEACRELYRTLPKLSLQEQKLWELTVWMNDRGLAVDLDGVQRAKELADTTRAELEARWVELTGVPAGSPKAAAALGMKSLAKAKVRRALKTQLEPKIKEALEVRQRLARSSVRKLVAFQDRTSADGRLRGNLIYAGAERTARWSGGGVQLHNFPRGLGADTELAHEALAAGVLPLLWDDTMRTISEMLKGFFRGPFLVGDFAQIEARVLLWLAGDPGLGAFARGEDVYSAMASDIYGYPVTKADYDEKLHIPKRQLGKIAILGCGYGLGAQKLREQLDEVFDVQVSEPMAYRIINAYREKYAAVPRLWALLERLAMTAMETGHHVYPVTMNQISAVVGEVEGRSLLHFALPSGRSMSYFDPEIRPVKTSWGETRWQLTYIGRNRFKGGAWERVSTYGGMLAENVVQAIARDVMADAMVRLDRAGFPLVLTVHDEIIAEARPERLAEFTRIMEEVPTWASGVPLAVETFATERYRK